MLNVFVSSVIDGLENYRAAAEEVIADLGYDVSRSENIGASPESPKSLLFEAIDAADVMVLVLGSRYGTEQGSGLSATQEEFRRAVESGTRVLAFVINTNYYEPRQNNFINEVQGWETGVFTGQCQSVDEFRKGLNRALHDYAVNRLSSTVNVAELCLRAQSGIPVENAGDIQPMELATCMAFAPRAEYLVPSTIEASETQSVLHRIATSEIANLGIEVQCQPSVSSGSLLLDWINGTQVRLDPDLTLMVLNPLPKPEGHLQVVIEESVRGALRSHLELGLAVVGEFDNGRRVTHLCADVRLMNSGLCAWRTFEEHRAYPNSVEYPIASSGRAKEALLGTEPLTLASLKRNLDARVEDLVVQLRRTFKADYEGNMKL